MLLLNKTRKVYVLATKTKFSQKFVKNKVILIELEHAMFVSIPKKVMNCSLKRRHQFSVSELVNNIYENHIMQ